MQARLGGGGRDVAEVECHPFLQGNSLARELRRLSDVADEPDSAAFTTSVAESLSLSSPPQHAQVALTNQFDWFEPFVDPRSSLAALP